MLVEIELKKLKTFDSSYFIGKSHFDEDGTQNYFAFQPMTRYLKVRASTNQIVQWKSKGLSDEAINIPPNSSNFFEPLFDYYVTKIRLKCNQNILKEDEITYSYGKIINIYIVYEISKKYNKSNYPTLENSLFGAVKLSKNTGVNNYKYSGYGIGVDRHGSVLYPGIGIGRNVIIFGVDMSSLTKIDNKKKDILILGKGPTQGLEHTLSAEKMYSINFTVTGKKFCLSLHYNGANSYLFVNATEIIKFKAKDSEIAATSSCLGNISKDWSIDDIKRTGLKGYVCDLSVDYDVIAVDDILDIHKYLMKKNDIV